MGAAGAAHCPLPVLPWSCRRLRAAEVLWGVFQGGGWSGELLSWLQGVLERL